MNKRELNKIDSLVVTYILKECYHKWESHGITMEEVHSKCKKCGKEDWTFNEPPQREPTRNPLDAMEVLRLCANKLCRWSDSGTSVSTIIGITYGGTKQHRSWSVGFQTTRGNGETLEIAICMFAIKLFNLGQQ